MMATTYSSLLSQYLHRFQELHPEISQAQLAEKTNVKRSTLSNWKLGKISRPAKKENILKLAVALELTREETVQLVKAGGYLLSAKDVKGFWPKLKAGLYEDDAMLTWATQGQFCPEAVVDRPNCMDGLYQAVFSDRVKKGLVIYGVGGSGKTTILSNMVLRFAKEIESKFPDGLVWVNFENTLAPPLTQIAVQSNLEVPKSDDSAGRLAVFSQLRNKKILWVLDGGHTLDTIQTWITSVQEVHSFYIVALQECPDPAWCLQRGVTTLQVGGFERNESLALTEKILGVPLDDQEIPDWEAAADWVGHHALSIRILAGIAWFDPTQERWKRILADLKQRGTTALQLRGISGAADKDLSVNASLSVGYQHIEKREPGAAACFRAIGILAREQFSPQLISALLGSEEKAIRILSILAQSGLLDLMRSEGQYRIHRIAHAFAKTMLTQNEQEYLMNKRSYVSAVAATSIRELNLPLDFTSVHLWHEYLHAMEIAEELNQYEEMVAIINNIYRSAFLFRQAEPVLQRARGLLILMGAHQDVFKGSIPILHNIIGDLLLMRRLTIPAKKHFDQTLLLSDNPYLCIEAYIQRAICANDLGDFTNMASDIDAAKRIFESLKPNLSEDIIHDFNNTCDYIFSNGADGIVENRFWIIREISKLSQAADLINKGDYKLALPVLESMTHFLANKPETVLYWEASLLLAEGYLRDGQVIQAEAVLTSVEAAMTNNDNIDELELLPARFWHLKLECARQQGDFNTEIMHAAKLFGMLGRRAWWLAEQRDQFNDENESVDE